MPKGSPSRSLTSQATGASPRKGRRNLHKLLNRDQVGLTPIINWLKTTVLVVSEGLELQGMGAAYRHFLRILRFVPTPFAGLSPPQILGLTSWCVSLISDTFTGARDRKPLHRRKSCSMNPTTSSHASHGAGSSSNSTRSRRMNEQAGGQRKPVWWMLWAAEIGSHS